MAPLDVQHLFNSKQFSDLVVLAEDGTSFYAHQMVVLRFPALKQIADVKKGGKASLHLDEDWLVVRQMLRWMYGREYDPNGFSVFFDGVTTEDVVKGWVGVWRAAQKYHIQELCEVAFDTFTKEVSTRLTDLDEAVSLSVGICDSCDMGQVAVILLKRIRELLYEKEALQTLATLPTPEDR